MHLSPHDLTPDFSAAAYPDELYRHYRRYLEETPVFRSADGSVYVTRHSDCTELLSNKNFSRTPAPDSCSPFDRTERIPTPLEVMISDWMIFMDPPRHETVRRAFQQPFNLKAIERLEPFIQSQAKQLLDILPQAGVVEMVQAYAFRIPVRVIAEVLGVPQSDADLFNTWSAQVAQALDTADAEEIRKGAEVALLLKEYFNDLLRRRESLSAHGLIRVMGSDAQTVLTADELVYGFVFLLLAGHETTKNLLACGIKILAERPAELSRLQQQPELMHGAVEEMLRFESPFQKVSRWANADAMFGDYFVPKGTMVTALIGAANRDASVFTEPDIFDSSRTRNRHIAFGSGIHHCLGALLARVEARIAFAELVPRLRQLEPVSHQWRGYSSLRSLAALSVRVELAC